MISKRARKTSAASQPTATKPVQLVGLSVNWMQGTGVLHGERSACSEHAGNELVDLLLTVAPDATLLVGVSLLLETAEGRAELEGPEEVVGFLEGTTDGPDLVDEVLNAGHTLLTESLLDDGVVVESESGSVDLAVASLVDELADSVAGGVAVGHVRLNNTDHVDGGTVQLDEDTVVELTKSEELHDLLGLRWELVDTK